MKLTPQQAEQMTNSLKRIGDAASKIGDVADQVSAGIWKAERDLRPARRSLRIAGAAAWASLLGRLFGR